MIVTLTTDFGTSDSYVAQMKGVLLSRAPSATLVDVTHEVPPGDVVGGALRLREIVPYFPEGTIHLAVVDPGVGTERAPLVVADGRALFVGPDNGLLTLALGPNARAFRLRPERVGVPEPSATFHGRDLFAPAAGSLVLGTAPEALGDPVADLVRLAWPAPALRAGTLHGEVVHVDRFGNLITSVEAARLAGRCWRCELGGRDLGPLRRTYGEVASGELLALVGSSGLVEIAERDGSAARTLGAGRGSAVALLPLGDEVPA